MSSRCCSSIARRSREHLQELGELRPLVARRRVDVEQLADLGQREPEPLAAQDQLDPRPLALAVDAGLARGARARASLRPRRSGSRASSARTPGRGRKSSTSARADRALRAGARAAMCGASRERPWRESGSGKACERTCRKRITIPYSLDRLGGIPDDAALHKSGAPIRPVSRSADARSSPRHDRRAARRARLPVRDAAGARRRRSRSRRAFIGCGCRCRSRSTTSTCGCSRTTTASRSSTAATATRATRALWEAPFRDNARASRRSGASSRRTAIPTMSATRRGSSARFGGAGRDDPCAEYLTAHALAGQHAAVTGRRRRSSSFAGTGWRPSTWRRSDARGNRYRRGVPELPQSFDRLRDGDVAHRGRHARGASIEGHGHSPEHASLYSRRARRADLGRHAAAAGSAPT